MLYTHPTPTLHRLTWPGAVLCFDYRGDRWGHTLALRQGDELPLLTSCEGTPEEAAPPSPAFQDLRWELLESPDQPVTGEFQLFGQCGRQIYSAAVRCTEGQIDFDLCMRVRCGESVQLASTYQPGASIAEADGTYLIGGGVQLEMTAIPNEPTSACHLDANGKIVIDTGALDVPVGKSKTFRWAYRLSWSQRVASATG